jgi:hypothetical protein
MVCLFVVSGHGPTYAQSIYRCGASYSSEANCGEGLASPLSLHGEAAHTAHDSLAQPMQNEADRLEKLRQREAFALAKRPATKAQLKKEKWSTRRTDAQAHHKRHQRKPASPYFTAKGTGEPKKP